MTTTSRAIGQSVVAGEGVHKVSESPSTPPTGLCRLSCWEKRCARLSTRPHRRRLAERTSGHNCSRLAMVSRGSPYRGYAGVGPRTWVLRVGGKVAARYSELGALLLGDVAELRVRITSSKNEQTDKGRTASVVNSRSIQAADHLADWPTIHPLRVVAQAPRFVQFHGSGSCPVPVPLSGRGVGRRTA